MFRNPSKREPKAIKIHTMNLGFVKWETGSQKIETRIQKMDTRSQKRDTRSWKMDAQSRKPGLRKLETGTPAAGMPRSTGDPWAQYINRLAWTCQLN